MQIETFSFRYGDNQGFFEWYRYDPAQGLWLDKFDGQRQEKHCEMPKEELAALAEILHANAIESWDGFCRLEYGMCSGNSWVLHVTYREGAEIHAMGHSEAPEGFEAGRAALTAFFGRFF